jgi:putative transposase
MPYWKCYYHIVWATKYREPVIIPAYEQIIFATIQEKCTEFGSSLLAVNAVKDHIHVAVCIPPGVAVSKWVGSAKGSTARAVNTSFKLAARFHWQGSYGVMSFGEKVLPQVKSYIENQKQHHAAGTVNLHLEQIGDES